MHNNTEQDILELQEILNQIGKEYIWRPVVVGDTILAEGKGDDEDGILADFHAFDFSGKSVADLGCNLGYYSFLVKSAGAAEVLGLDIDPRIIRGCNILKRLRHHENITFMVMDITKLSTELRYDVGIMVDCIGKNVIYSGMLIPFLDALEQISRNEMIISIRPVYRISKHFQNDISTIMGRYSEKYVENDKFNLLDFVKDRFRKDWEIKLLESSSKRVTEVKETVHLFRDR